MNKERVFFVKRSRVASFLFLFPLDKKWMSSEQEGSDAMADSVILVCD